MNVKQLRSCNTFKVFCQDGPYKGQPLYLSANQTTFVFTASGQTGFYLAGKWHAVQKH